MVGYYYSRRTLDSLDDEIVANIDNVVTQIQAAVGVETEIFEENLDDIRQELERLRDDDKKPIISVQ